MGRGEQHSQSHRGLGWGAFPARSRGINSPHLSLSFSLNSYKFFLLHKQLIKCLQAEEAHLTPWMASELPFLFCPERSDGQEEGRTPGSPKSLSHTRESSTGRCPESQGSPRKRRGWTAPHPVFSMSCAHWQRSAESIGLPLGLWEQVWPNRRKCARWKHIFRCYFSDSG